MTTAALAAVLAELAGCTLLRTDVSSCEDSSQCRAEFGLRSVCGDNGLCRVSPIQSRCTKTYPPDLLTNPAAHRSRIVIGNLMDRSLATHRARENAAELAFKQANSQGGIENRELGLVFCTIEENSRYDELARTDAAVASARYLVDSLGVPAIIGPASSGDTQEVFLRVQGSGVLVISPSATSTTLQALDPSTVSDEAPGLLWRTVPPDSLQGRAIAHDMLAPGPGRGEPVSSVAVIHEAGSYGEGLATEFVEAFGGGFMLLSYNDQGRRAEAIATAGSAAVDEVLFISSQADDVIAFLDGATLPGYNGKDIFLSDAAANSDVLDQANPTRFPQVRGSRPAPLDPLSDIVYSVFLTGYQTEYGQDATIFSFTANAYDAAWLVAYGVAWAIMQEDAISGHNIARGLRRLSGGPEIEIRPTAWNGVLQQFRAGQSVDITGASGPLDFDPVSEETSGNIQIWTIQDGQVIGVDTWVP